MTSNRPSFLWLDGQIVPWESAMVHVSELGWSTVGGVFEGIRGYWNADQGEVFVFRLREHMERLQRSMKLVRLDLDYSIDQLIEATTELIRKNEIAEDCYIQPMGYTAHSFQTRYDSLEAQSALQIIVKPMSSHLASEFTQRAKVSSWRRISEDVMPPRVKNLSNYRNGQLARQEVALDGYDTAVILNDLGKVTEGPGACLMFVRDGELITPDPTSGILESITREAVLILARDVLKIPVQERVVDRTELYLADEVFFCGTAAEISPVISVDQFTVGNGEIGPVTGELATLLDGVVRGTDPRYAEWRTPVGLASRVLA